MMGDQVVDINVATVEDLETLVGVGRAKAEAIVNTRTSMVEFGSVEDLLAVPGIGRSLIEQNRVCLVCRPLSGAGTAPLTRHAAARRSLRRASHDTRPRPEPQHEPQAEGPVTGGRLSRGATREQTGEHSCPTRLPGSGRRADPRPREDSPQEGVEGEGRSLVPVVGEVGDWVLTPPMRTHPQTYPSRCLNQSPHSHLLMETPPHLPPRPPRPLTGRTRVRGRMRTMRMMRTRRTRRATWTRTAWRRRVTTA